MELANVSNKDDEIKKMECVYTCMHMHIYAHICAYVCMCVDVHVLVHTCTFMPAKKFYSAAEKNQIMSFAGK